MGADPTLKYCANINYVEIINIMRSVEVFKRFRIFKNALQFSNKRFMWRVINISPPLNLRDLLICHYRVTYLQKLYVTVVNWCAMVKNAFNEAIALKRKRGKPKRSPRVQNTFSRLRFENIALDCPGVDSISYADCNFTYAPRSLVQSRPFFFFFAFDFMARLELSMTV